MVTFSRQFITSSLYKLAIHRAFYCPTLHHQNTDATARDVAATCNHAYLGTQSIRSWKRFYVTEIQSLISEYAELTMHFIVKQVELFVLDLSKESVKCLIQNHKD